MKTRLILTGWIAILLPILIFAQERTILKNESETEQDAVRAAALDYVEGIYEVDPSRIERSVHPNLAKRGFYMDSDYQEYPMNYDQLVELAGKYNKEGKIPEDAPKEIEILDLLDQTASVKLTAEWGIDYMHLAKYDSKWKIVNVLWQSHPPKNTASQSSPTVLKVGFGGGMKSADHGVTEIHLERTRCYGTCPVYSVTIKNDGSFVYHGKAHVDHIGEYRGTVSKWAFNQLASFIKDADYMNLESNYKSRITDMATVKTAVKMGGEKKTVSNYANAGPAKLWAIEQLIDKIVMEGDWENSSEKN